MHQGPLRSTMVYTKKVYKTLCLSSQSRSANIFHSEIFGYWDRHRHRHRSCIATCKTFVSACHHGSQLLDTSHIITIAWCAWDAHVAALTGMACHTLQQLFVTHGSNVDQDEMVNIMQCSKCRPSPPSAQHHAVTLPWHSMSWHILHIANHIRLPTCLHMGSRPCLQALPLQLCLQWVNY